MQSFHLSLGAHLLLWGFPLVLTTVTVVLALVQRPPREDAP
jgi:cytochrome c-type biogenesis protein CcmH/NrfF